MTEVRFEGGDLEQMDRLGLAQGQYGDFAFIPNSITPKKAAFPLNVSLMSMFGKLWPARVAVCELSSSFGGVG